MSISCVTSVTTKTYLFPNFVNLMVTVSVLSISVNIRITILCRQGIAYMASGDEQGRAGTGPRSRPLIKGPDQGATLAVAQDVRLPRTCLDERQDKPLFCEVFH